jgi:hypothetical protein
MVGLVPPCIRSRTFSKSSWRLSPHSKNSKQRSGRSSSLLNRRIFWSRRYLLSLKSWMNWTTNLGDLLSRSLLRKRSLKSLRKRPLIVIWEILGLLKIGWLSNVLTWESKNSNGLSNIHIIMGKIGKELMIFLLRLKERHSMEYLMASALFISSTMVNLNMTINLGIHLMHLLLTLMIIGWHSVVCALLSTELFQVVLLSLSKVMVNQSHTQWWLMEDQPKDANWDAIITIGIPRKLQLLNIKKKLMESWTIYLILIETAGSMDSLNALIILVKYSWERREMITTRMERSGSCKMMGHTTSMTW